MNRVCWMCKTSRISGTGFSFIIIIIIIYCIMLVICGTFVGLHQLPLITKFAELFLVGISIHIYCKTVSEVVWWSQCIFHLGNAYEDEKKSPVIVLLRSLEQFPAVTRHHYELYKLCIHKNSTKEVQPLISSNKFQSANSQFSMLHAGQWITTSCTMCSGLYAGSHRQVT